VRLWDDTASKIYNCVFTCCMVLVAGEIMADTDYTMEGGNSGVFTSPFHQDGSIIDYQLQSCKQEIQKHDLVKKALSVQEKNKIAQKRFRDRQKAKMQELMHRLDCTEQQVKHLSEENEYLSRKVQLLEKSRAGIAWEGSQFVGDGGDSAQTQCKVGDVLSEGADDSESNFRMYSKEFQAKGLINCLVTSCWRNLVRELNTLLIQHENACRSSDTLKKYTAENIHHAIEEGVGKYMGTLRAFPHVFTDMPEASFDNAEEAREFWGKVVTRMDMKNVQVRDLNILQDSYNDRMVQRRLQHESTLQALQQTGSKFHSSGIDASIRLLQGYIRSDRRDLFDYWTTVFDTILDPVQKAQCIVQSYPLYPDMREIASIATASAC
jgi:hypothetical protein